MQHRGDSKVSRNDQPNRHWQGQTGEPRQLYAMPRYSHLNPSLPQPYRLRNQQTGRELVIAARPGVAYVDEVTGEPLEVVGKLLPVSPSPSRLPWSVQNLRSCPSCGELVQKDLNYCPYDGRRLAPLDVPGAANAVQPSEGEHD